MKATKPLVLTADDLTAAIVEFVESRKLMPECDGYRVEFDSDNFTASVTDAGGES